MGWFDSQIRERREHDDALMQEALRSLALASAGKKPADVGVDAAVGSGALEVVLAYYGARPAHLPRKAADLEDAIDWQSRATGVRYRRISLGFGWTKFSIGALLAVRDDGVAVALLPNHLGYALVDPETGKKVQVTPQVAATLKGPAWCFYRPLPEGRIGVRDLLVYMARCLDVADYVVLLASMVALTLLGTLLTTATSVVFGPVVESGDVGLVAPVALLFLGVYLAQAFLNLTKSEALGRVQGKISVQVEAATMMRVLSMPPSFFRTKAAGDLAQRMKGVGAVASSLQSIVLGASLTSVFSLVYLVQIFTIAPALAAPAAIVIACNVAVTLFSMLSELRRNRRDLLNSAEVKGLEFALLGGVQKIRLAGAEKRAFGVWARTYSKLAAGVYNRPPYAALQAFVSLAGVIGIYLATISSGVSLADYMAFSVAYGMVLSAFMTLASTVGQAAQIRPYLELAGPILEAEPEQSTNKEQVGELFGGVELSGVTFGYAEGQPPVLNDLSFKVRPGEYVAVVGKTGCGKSTLVRMLLGFDEPWLGSVYYDGRDLATLDPASVRRNLGVVLQDAKLFGGSIYDNISVGAPGLPLADAWDAAEKAGIADDIRAMPMGMGTMVGEGSGGISGGQRQRIVIARAIAAKPRLLILDEATSALDNATQKHVSDALAGLHCTRIVIAHRLSTVKACDRILVLDGGRIVEDGRYDELIAKDGIFADLVRRQQV